jgi:hypothetical protein
MGEATRVMGEAARGYDDIKMSEPTRDENGQIGIYLGRVHDRINVLDECVHILAQRLEPATISDARTVGSTEVGPPDHAPMSPIASTLVEATVRLERLAEQLRYLTNRLDI